jgi:hypothetical protein
MSGHISVKNVYEALSNKLWKYKLGGWRRNLWKWDCPLKIKLFIWLIAENKILSWKIYRREDGRGLVFVICAKIKENLQNIYL